jgi:hypothetical protein
MKVKDQASRENVLRELVAALFSSKTTAMACPPKRGDIGTNQEKNCPV